MNAAGKLQALVHAGCAIVVAAVALFTTPSLAQPWPQRPVKLILPFGPASGIDIAARLFADRLAARWGKPVVLDNRPGGDGLVAISAFLAANDDHTLFFAPTGTFLSHPYEHDKLPYDAERDLIPIVGVATIVLAITVSESLKINSLNELVALARAQPGKLNAATAAGHTSFLWAGFLKQTGLQIAKVPYRDIIQAPTDLAEGRIQILLSSFAAVQPQVQTGKVKVLALTSRERAPIAPGVQTAAEAGYPALTLDGLIGLYGPRGISGELRERIAASFRDVVAENPLIASRLAATGQIVNVLGPAEFAAGVKDQREQLAAIAKALGMKAAQ